MKIRFLTIDEVQAGQLEQLRLYGGGSPGLRSQHGLASAVESVQQTFGGQFLLADVFEMAAGYLRYLVLGHPFENGNKRVALGSALEFLYLNGHKIDADNADMVNLTLGAIIHHLEVDELSEFFRRHAASSGCTADDTSEEALAAARAWTHQAYAPCFHKLAE